MWQQLLERGLGCPGHVPLLTQDFIFLDADRRLRVSRSLVPDLHLLRAGSIGSGEYQSSPTPPPPSLSCVGQLAEDKGDPAVTRLQQVRPGIHSLLSHPRGHQPLFTNKQPFTPTIQCVLPAPCTCPNSDGHWPSLLSTWQATLQLAHSSSLYPWAPALLSYESTGKIVFGCCWVPVQTSGFTVQKGLGSNMTLESPKRQPLPRGPAASSVYTARACPRSWE